MGTPSRGSAHANALNLLASWTHGVFDGRGTAWCSAALQEETSNWAGFDRIWGANSETPSASKSQLDVLYGKGNLGL